MKTISYLRAIKFGFIDFGRNIWLSLGALAIIVLTLFTISLLIFLNILSNQALLEVQDKVSISLYFKKETSEEQIKKLREEISGWTQVKETMYISQKEALMAFREKHKENPLIMESLAELEENPLKASLVIKAKEPEQYVQIAERLESKHYETQIDKINFRDNKPIIDKLSRITKNIKRIGIVAGAILCAISILVVFNTIRLTIYTKKREIEIMKLVGATNQFIQLPYLLEGALYGLFAGIINCGILYYLFKYISPKIYTFFENQSLNLFNYFTTNIVLIFILCVGFAIFLGTVSSFIATRRYLKV